MRSSIGSALTCVVRHERLTQDSVITAGAPEQAPCGGRRRQCIEEVS